MVLLVVAVEGMRREKEGFLRNGVEMVSGKWRDKYMLLSGRRKWSGCFNGAGRDEIRRISSLSVGRIECKW